MSNSTIDTLANIWNTIFTAWRMVVIFAITLGSFGFGIYLIYISQTEYFNQSYQEGMHLGIGLVTLMLGIVLIGIQVYLIRQTQSKLKKDEKQFHKKTNQN